MARRRQAGRAARRRGRPLLGAVAGLVSGLAGGLDALLLGWIALDSAVLVIAPVAGLLVGVAFGWLAPLRRRQPRAAR